MAERLVATLAVAVMLLAGCGAEPPASPSTSATDALAATATATPVTEGPRWPGSVDVHVGADIPIPPGTTMLLLRRQVGKGYGYWSLVRLSHVAGSSTTTLEVLFPKEGLDASGRPLPGGARPATLFGVMSNNNGPLYASLCFGECDPVFRDAKRESAVYRSDDAGETWREVYRRPGLIIFRGVTGKELIVDGLEPGTALLLPFQVAVPVPPGAAPFRVFESGGRRAWLDEQGRLVDDTGGRAGFIQLPDGYAITSILDRSVGLGIALTLNGPQPPPPSSKSDDQRRVGYLGLFDGSGVALNVLRFAGVERPDNGSSTVTFDRRTLTGTFDRECPGSIGGPMPATVDWAAGELRFYRDPALVCGSSWQLIAFLQGP